jgi:hypothetical protein
MDWGVGCRLLAKPIWLVVILDYSILKIQKACSKER